MDYYQYKVSPYYTAQQIDYFICFKPIDYVYHSNNNKCVCICTPMFFFKIENNISTVINANQLIYSSTEYNRFDINKLYDIQISRLEIINDSVLPLGMKREKKLKNILENG